MRNFLYHKMSPIFLVLDVKKIVRFQISVFKRLVLQFIRLFLYPVRKRLSLAYGNEIKTDGIGAQLHRVISIYCLAQYLKVDYFHNGLSNFAVHPLDGISSHLDELRILDKVNDFFHIDNNSDVNHICEILTIKQLKLINLFFIAFRLILNPNVNYKILLAEPFYVSDLEPKIFTFISNSKLPILQILEQQRNFNSQGRLEVAIHYRRGVGNLIVHPGEAKTRELPFDYYSDCLEYLALKYGKDNLFITVHTDAPSNDFNFKPLAHQEHYWKETKQFNDGKVKVEGLDLKKLFANRGYEVEVIAGGEVMDTIIELSSSDALIMSRSSLSYLSAILNSKGEVLYPEGFWHPPLNSWTRLH